MPANRSAHKKANIAAHEKANISANDKQAAYQGTVKTANAVADYPCSSCSASCPCDDTASSGADECHRSTLPGAHGCANQACYADKAVKFPLFHQKVRWFHQVLPQGKTGL